MLRAPVVATILAGALGGSAMAQAPDASCALPSEPEGITAALDAAISGPADKDRACTKALLIPEARLMFVSLGADGAPSRRLETLDDWIARVKARGHAMLRLGWVGGKVLAFDLHARDALGTRVLPATDGSWVSVDPFTAPVTGIDVARDVGGRAQSLGLGAG
jgi:hypothetical protein